MYETGTGTICKDTNLKALPKPAPDYNGEKCETHGTP